MFVDLQHTDKDCNMDLYFQIFESKNYSLLVSMYQFGKI